MNNTFLLIAAIVFIATRQKKSTPILGTDISTPNGVVHFQTPVAP